MRTIRSVADLLPAEVDWVMRRSSQHRTGGATGEIRPRTIVGLAFLEASLRTRTGFAAAAVRLGATPIEVLSVRSGPATKPESIGDTVRTLAGYSDVLVVRAGEPLTVPDGVNVPVLNGGDRGPEAEHPSQALIDLFALQQLPVQFDALTIALCGDLRMRAARSLLSLMCERPPKRLILITDHALTDGFSVPPRLQGVSEYRTLDELDDVDALYVVGIPYGALDAAGRTRLRVTTEHLDRLPDHAGVFSPLPVIDEVDRGVLSHPNVRMFEQSDDGLFVRMALLELLLGAGPRV